MIFFWYSANLHTNNAKEFYSNSLVSAKKDLQVVANGIKETLYLSYYLKNGIEKRINIIPNHKPLRLKTIDYTI